MNLTQLQASRAYYKALQRSPRYRAQQEGARCDYAMDHGEFSGPFIAEALRAVEEDIAARVGCAFGLTADQVQYAAMEHGEEEMHHLMESHRRPT